MDTNMLHDTKELYKEFCTAWKETQELDAAYSKARLMAEDLKMQMQNSERYQARIWRQYIEVRKVSQI